jgi:paired amphipathic helix protein Sin3a
VASKKNVHEEALFRCEDERFELDLILECNIATIHVLEVVMDELDGMPEEQRKSYRFNAKTLGGRSEVCCVGVGVAWLVALSLLIPCPTAVLC